MPATKAMKKKTEEEEKSHSPTLRRARASTGSRQQHMYRLPPTTTSVSQD